MLKAMLKFQGVLKMFMLGMLKTILKTVLKYKKIPSHFTARVEIVRQISFFKFDFTHFSDVRHIIVTNSSRNIEPFNFVIHFLKLKLQIVISLKNSSTL